jgi:phosphatidylserine/phosphatidylglycerophosphate/cardiolipin synthase-like enzyme
MIRSVWGAGEHVALLESILERSATYVFIHSAFLTGSRAAQVAEPITRALQRGVDVLIGRGGTEEAGGADDDGVTVFKKIAYDVRGARGRFFFEPYPTASHVKLIVRDGEEVCVGSFNWLSAPIDSPRAEFSLCVSSREFAAVACDVAADLFRERNAAWPAQILRTRVDPESSAAITDGLEIRLVMDAENRDCLFNYLDQSVERLLIFSDKVTSKEDPLLRDKLLRTARALAVHSRLAIRFSSVDGDRAPILDGLKDAGAIVVEDGSNHMKALVSDDLRALITSFNLLSFGGHSSRRSSVFEMGIELRTAGSAVNLFETLLAPLYQ